GTARGGCDSPGIRPAVRRARETRFCPRRRRGGSLAILGSRKSARIPFFVHPPPSSHHPRRPPPPAPLGVSSSRHPAPLEKTLEHARRLRTRKARAKRLDTGIDRGIERKPFPLAHQRLLEPNGFGTSAQDGVHPGVDRRIELADCYDFLQQT